MLFGMLTLTLFVLLSAPPVSPEALDWNREESAKNLPREISRLDELISSQKKLLAFAKKGVINKQASGITTSSSGPWQFPSAETKRTHIAEMEKSLESLDKKHKALKAGTERLAVLIDPRKIRTGQCGQINQAIALQVIDAKTLLANLIWAGTVDEPHSPHAEVLVLIETDSTKGIADGEECKLTGVFEVTGTRTYQSKSGPRSVWVLSQRELLKPRK